MKTSFFPAENINKTPGRVVQKLVNADPGLKANRCIDLYKNVFCHFVLFTLRLSKFKTGGQTAFKQKTSPQSYKTEMKNSCLSWVSLRLFPSIALRIPTAHSFTHD